MPSWRNNWPRVCLPLDDTMRSARLSLILILLLTAMNSAACTAPQDPTAVVQAFIRAVDGENLDAAFKLLADEFVVAYGGQEEQTLRKFEVRPAAEKAFKDYNFSLEASNFQLQGEEVYFSLTITDEKDDKSATCTCEVTVTQGLIQAIKIVFCSGF